MTPLRSMIAPGQHVDAILDVFLQVPTRPTACIELGYVEAMDAVACVVFENKSVPRSEIMVARFAGYDLEVSYPQYDPATQKSTDVWQKWNINRFKSDAEALCYRVLLASDVFCPNQARADFAEAMQYNLWDDLLREMKTLQPIASVMLS